MPQPYECGIAGGGAERRLKVTTGNGFLKSDCLGHPLRSPGRDRLSNKAAGVSAVASR
jgi:hypothetical protein